MNNLSEMGTKEESRTPYRTHLDPCEFWLSSTIKENFRGSRFEDTEKMKEAVTKALYAVQCGELPRGLHQMAGTLQQAHSSQKAVL